MLITNGIPHLFSFFCVAVSFIHAYHLMRRNADPESIFFCIESKVPKCIFLSFCECGLQQLVKVAHVAARQTKRWLHGNTEEGSTPHFCLFPSALAPRPRGPKEVGKIRFINCLCPTTAPHFQHAIAETSARLGRTVAQRLFQSRLAFL